jgi:hypothetical protein
MKNPAPATILALKLADYAHTHAVDAVHRHNGKLALDATRAVAIAAQVRWLVEAGCNAELTDRQSKRLDSLRKRANEILLPYTMKLDNPWGLCHYAVPLVSDDRLSESDCTFLA